MNRVCYQCQRVVLAAALAFLLIPPLTAVAHDPRPSATSLDDLKRSVAGQHAKLAGLFAEYRSWHDGRPETIVTFAVAASDSSRFESLWHGRRDARHEDQMSITRYYDGEFFNLFNHYERSYEVARRYALPQYLSKIRDLTLFECLGWWPPGDSEPPPRREGRPEYVAEIFADPETRLLADEDVVDGHPCRIVELPGAVRLWIDPGLGVIRRREQLGSSQEGRATVLAVYELSDFRQREGIWLPHRIIRRFSGGGPTTHHEIDRYEVNGQVGDVFRFDPPPGSIVYDRDTDTYSQVPGGLDGLDLVARRVIEQSSADGQRREGSGLASGASCVALGVLLGLAVQVVAARFWW
jgi:hypothetical protein